MSAVGNEEKYWNRLVKELGYTEVYRHNGRLKKNIHSIKAFTETQAEEAVNKFYADAYGDHSAYLKQYIRWKEDKKIAKFRLMEPLLNLYTKIEKVETNPELKVENDLLRQKLAVHDILLLNLSEKEKAKTQVIPSDDKVQKVLKFMEEQNLL